MVEGKESEARAPIRLGQGGSFDKVFSEVDNIGNC